MRCLAHSILLHLQLDYPQLDYSQQQQQLTPPLPPKSHTFVVDGAGEKDEAVNATVDEPRIAQETGKRPSYSYFALPHFFPYLPSYFIESLLHLESNWEFEMQLVYVLTLCPGNHMYLSARQSHQSYIQHL